MQNSKGDASTIMERFEFDDERALDIFSGFVGKAKVVLTTLVENIKFNIKGYETKIEDTTKEIEDNEISREKCIHEISKMESKIAGIKDVIENVESTYKKIADAYSSTSRGETKELYSEIIDGARANCEKDVEKNRSEIARLNSDIEAIKNNIAEFSKVIDDLNRDLENYNLELFKYNKALEYMDKVATKNNEDLEEISNRKEVTKKTEVKTAKRTDVKSRGKVEEKEPIKTSRESAKSSVLKTLDEETYSTPKSILEEKKPKDNYDATLKQIYDLTGYKPSDKELEIKSVAPEVKQEEKKVYTDNLESLFTNPQVDNKVEPVIEGSKKPEMAPFMDNDFSSWEEILNTPEVKPEAPVDNGAEDTVNQLLTPYGTNYARLKRLIGNEIGYKDGSKKPFELTIDDVIKAVNAIDGNDLKKMKMVGPEITLLRKVLKMKEGNL